MTGDFNSILHPHEKLGGKPFNISKAKPFANCINNCKLIDLGFTGPRFTWSNKHRNKDTHIRERLDSFLCNQEWIKNFPNTVVKHISNSSSDHSPLLLDTYPNIVYNRRRFIYDNTWSKHNSYNDTVRRTWYYACSGSHTDISKFSRFKSMLDKNSRIWKNFFLGNAARDIQSLKNNLENIRIQIENNPSSDLISMEHKIQSQLGIQLSNEASYWRNKTRINWIKFGDTNSKFFQASVNYRRKNNRIESIYDHSSGWKTDLEDIKNLFKQHFENVFKSNNVSNSQPYFPSLAIKITEQDSINLCKEVSTEEILSILKKMDPNKTPGTDGLNSNFFINYWGLVGDNITSIIKSFFSNGNLPPDLNETLIVLIPKKENPTQTSHFRPISLCNVIYKIISSILVNRIRPFFKSSYFSISKRFCSWEIYSR